MKIPSQRSLVLCFLFWKDIKLMMWDDLKIRVKSFKKTHIRDLIKPRLVGIRIFGLPFIVNSLEVAQKLVKPVGKIMGNRLDNGTQNFTKFFMSTKIFDKIELCRIAILDNHTFVVRTHEEENQYCLMSSK